ncbi:MAG: hypothetical protein EPN72_10915 [Nevskiaceae bacterium]|nr:MAG: hypothetical protein EPN63_05925 [Nevskiaceae bacterium]TBR72249.1 MAG: hypothetical protein EPN72_10915 [Nevskiaceae bacterium]
MNHPWICAVIALALPTLASAATSAVPAASCQPPKSPPANGASAPQIDAYNNALPKYRQCVQDYVNARTADAEKYTALAKTNSEAANAAVEQYNKFVKSANNH